MQRVEHLVVGAGEVGAAVLRVLQDGGYQAAIRDKDLEVPGVSLADVLHVCFPWSDEFVDQVCSYVDDYRADLVVVHSTVAPGTCDRWGWVHAPVRGRHPHLYEGLCTFDRHFGGEAADDASRYFRHASLVTVHPRAIDTESAKLWELVQLGVQVKIQHAIYGWCHARGVDPEVVYTGFASTYNDGYRRLDDRFVRPVLDYVPGPIGGHCVARNAGLLDHWLAQWVALDADVDGDTQSV